MVDTVNCMRLRRKKESYCLPEGVLRSTWRLCATRSAPKGHGARELLIYTYHGRSKNI